MTQNRDWLPKADIAVIYTQSNYANLNTFRFLRTIKKPPNGEYLAWYPVKIQSLISSPFSSEDQFLDLNAL